MVQVTYPDRLTLSRKRFSEIFRFLLLLVCFSEIFYTLVGISTSQITIFVCLVSCVLCFIQRERIEKSDIFCFIVAVYTAVYSISLEGIRYLVTLVMIVFARKLNTNSLPEELKFFVIYALPFSILQILSHQDRIHGFYALSPTMFACFLLIAEVYLLICIYNSRLPVWNVIFPIVCLVVNYFTGVRTTLLAGAALLLFYLFLILLESNHVINRKKIILLVIPIAVGILLLFSSQLFELVGKIFNRNTSASNMTRLSLYKKVISYWLSTWRSLMFGNRGGSVELLLSNGETYMPAHMDYLLVLCEYGVIGFLAIFWFFFRKKKSVLYFFCLFTVCAFHNAVLSPSIMLLLTITMADIERCNYRLY